MKHLSELVTHGIIELLIPRTQNLESNSIFQYINGISYNVFNKFLFFDINQNIPYNYIDEYYPFFLRGIYFSF